MGFHARLLVILAMNVAACASLEATQHEAKRQAYPPDVFAHRVSTSEVVLFWNCVRVDPHVMRVEGVAQNPSSPQPVRYLELELVGVDGRNRIVSQARGSARDSMLHTNQVSPFGMDLRTAGSEVRFDLYYQYRFLEGQEMDALLSGPPVEGLRLLAQTSRFMARDVCSETQHRIR